MSGNADQIEYWNGPAGQRWAEARDTMDANMASIAKALLDFVAAKPGEHVLDIGCGSGGTTLAYAKAVGVGGQVIGADISRPMLAVARERGAANGSKAEFIEADASTFAFKPEFDVVASRFGVMFFADPTAAFANIRKALKPGGRLAFVCWRSMPENLWAAAPFAAARDLLPEQPPADPHAPGPFAFADSARTVGILEGAGFKDVTATKLDTVMHIARTAPEAAQFSLRIGPLSRAASVVEPDVRAKIEARVAEAMKKFETPDGVSPPAACWLVGARV
ncbi:MAG: methyltransferase domain-containing protein [Proteobacteria bacterium]|nr:methyltransferase domain-containing protein [Pseudomonadota bacterium]